MHILSIDPGTNTSAILVYDSENKVIETHDSEVRNDLLVLAIKTLRHQYRPQLAIEIIQCMGQIIGKSTIETAYVIGGLFQEFGRSNFIEVPRSEVKMTLCGSCRKIKDANIRAALIDLIGEPGKKSNPGPTYGIASHAWSALAIAVTAKSML